MNKLKMFLAIFLVVAILNSCNAQDKEVYEIPFSIEKKLLVFKGKLNGIETDFAFDTGAAEGIATTKNESTGSVERKKSMQKILDANGKISSLQSVVTKQLSIGGYTFDNVKATMTDMQYLYCMDLYLLGADIIRKLNWEIDFKRMILKVSKSSFAVSENMKVIPVTYLYNTPRFKLTIDGNIYNNILIDFGYTGSLTLPNTDKKIKELLERKKQENLVTTKMTSNFAALGISKPSFTETVIIDSLFINGVDYKKVSADILSNTSFKIGLNFFNSICEKIIINNNEKKYYLQLKTKVDLPKFFPVAVLLKEGKLIVSSLTIYSNASENIFTINEEIKSINRKKSTDFKSECDYLVWYFSTKWDNHILEKINGQIIKIEKSN